MKLISHPVQREVFISEAYCLDATMLDDGTLIRCHDVQHDTVHQCLHADAIENARLVIVEAVPVTGMSVIV